MTTTTLSSRETAKLYLLAQIAANPGQNKASHTAGQNNQTRANQYRMIDYLIRRGLVANRSASSAQFALYVTSAGDDELAAHEERA